MCLVGFSGPLLSFCVTLPSHRSCLLAQQFRIPEKQRVQMYPSPPRWFLPAPRQSSVFRFLLSLSPCLFFLQNLHCPVQLSGVLPTTSLWSSRGYTFAIACGFVAPPACSPTVCTSVQTPGMGACRGEVKEPPHCAAPRAPGLPGLQLLPQAPTGPLRVPATPVTSAHLAGTRFRAVMCPSPMARVSWCLRMGSL